MSKYGSFTQVARDQADVESSYRRLSDQGWGSLLLEEGTFIICREDFGDLDLDPDVELYLGDGAWLEVRDEMVPTVCLTLPDSYVEALDRDPVDSDKSRRLYWSSPTPPEGLDDPTQNPYGYGDVTLYVPESLEPAYREEGFSSYGTPSRRYLEIWEDYRPYEGFPPVPGPRGAESEAVEAPGHYTWLGQSLAALGLSDAANVESWDVLDAAFPSDPLLWNCGKYLLRQGRKGGEEKRLEDLRKARQYLDRRIAQLTGSEVSD
nr:MAG TPA: nucelotide kinase [Caudoviricetes sp.]